MWAAEGRGRGGQSSGIRNLGREYKTRIPGRDRNVTAAVSPHPLRRTSLPSESVASDT
jgi:hypothetical protein